MTEQAVKIGPGAYEKWRSTSLGDLTAEIENRLILELSGDLAGRRLLDVGCGDGLMALAAQRAGARSVGLDPDPAMIAAARRRADDLDLEAGFALGEAGRLPFQDESFDLVWAVTVLCFVADPRAALGEMARVLKPEGRLVLGDLGRWSLWAARRRVRAWLGSKTWRRAVFRSPRQMRALAEGSGLAVLELRGAIYYPPSGWWARRLAPRDRFFSRITALGAAFIALLARKPGTRSARRDQ